ncbi:DUF736 family protein [Yoonia sp. SS1-5]|uniref:DUF736 family protein n=1 Tax=Yoonia rhodophyticola TaxID=3137370 RepID=A0AAN0M6L8_9RHOB
MLNGKLIENATGFNLTLSTLTFDIAGLQVVPNPYKQKDNHPDYHVEFRTPRGTMMRVGAMWRAISERSQAEYFSITLTDKNNKTWRMNAVRNDSLRDGEWAVVPLAGGEPEPIMVAGHLELLDDGNMVGTIESFDFAFDVVAVQSETKSDNNHPDFHLEARSPNGTIIRVGSVWEAESNRGNKYYSVAFWSPRGSQHRANGVRNDDAGDDPKFNLIPLADRRESEDAFA